MKEIIVIGHSPGKVSKEKSKTLQRVKKWLDNAEAYEYKFVNLVDYHAPNLKLSEVTLDVETLSSYNYIITLGNLADNFLKRKNIKHYGAPHPSGLNRKFNDKTYEPQVMEQIKEYLK